MAVRDLDAGYKFDQAKDISVRCAAWRYVEDGEQLRIWRGDAQCVEHHGRTGRQAVGFLLLSTIAQFQQACGHGL